MYETALLVHLAAINVIWHWEQLLCPSSTIFSFSLSGVRGSRYSQSKPLAQCRKHCSFRRSNRRHSVMKGSECILREALLLERVLKFLGQSRLNMSTWHYLFNQLVKYNCFEIQYDNTLPKETDSGSNYRGIRKEGITCRSETTR